jgi:hypothetical protein
VTLIRQKEKEEEEESVRKESNINERKEGRKEGEER